MSKKIVGVLVIGVVVLGMVVSQQIGRTAPALTALDYAEIDQLYTRYNFAFDTLADDGGMWARTFTEDGVFDVTNPFSDQVLPVQGHEQLKAFVKSANGHTPRHFVTNIMIEPTAEGAIGSAYAFIVPGAEDGTPSTIARKAAYYDELVRTPEGWRFKKRTGTWGGFPDELLQALEQ